MRLAAEWANLGVARGIVKSAAQRDAQNDQKCDSGSSRRGKEHRAAGTSPIEFPWIVERIKMKRNCRRGTEHPRINGE